MSLVTQVAGALIRGLTDSTQPPARRAQLLGGFLASGVRLALGTVATNTVATSPTAQSPASTRTTAHSTTVPGPADPASVAELVLYDDEGEPDCRPVREALTTLDLDVLIRPCPTHGTRFSGELGGARVPLLVDGAERIQGSSAIISHLYRRYANRPAPTVFSSAPLGLLNKVLATPLAGGKVLAQPATKAPHPLELYAFESSPFSRFVRRTLCALELEHRSISMGKKSAKRAAFKAKYGKLQFPLLVDPNTQRWMYESADIQKYLHETYGAR